MDENTISLWSIWRTEWKREEIRRIKRHGLRMWMRSLHEFKIVFSYRLYLLGIYALFSGISLACSLPVFFFCVFGKRFPRLFSETLWPNSQIFGQLSSTTWWDNILSVDEVIVEVHSSLLYISLCVPPVMFAVVTVTIFSVLPPELRLSSDWGFRTIDSVLWTISFRFSSTTSTVT